MRKKKRRTIGPPIGPREEGPFSMLSKHAMCSPSGSLVDVMSGDVREKLMKGFEGMPFSGPGKPGVPGQVAVPTQFETRDGNSIGNLFRDPVPVKRRRSPLRMFFGGVRNLLKVVFGRIERG